MADISFRKWIRWQPPSPTPPPTSTIVLTSPGRRFVDVRVFLPLPTPPDSDLPLEQLEWAIAGTSTSSPVVVNESTQKVEEYSHCVWSHWIDSRVHEGDVPADEGDNYTVEGRPELTLEKGRMVNPDSGRVEGYEEMWEGKGVEGVEGVECLVLVYDAEAQGDDDDDWMGGGGAEGRGEGVRRGMVVRLGGYVQGFLREGEDVRVERWVWEGGKWERRIRIGSGGLKQEEGVIPVEFMTEVGAQMEVGDEVMGASGRRWKVVEKSMA
ncbi:hypothetical protein QBC41DRAFT_280178 [Cercophora samala]|uniref:Protein HRI1 n=1 Tax=Cercophora samala TaxID=330535 RepID=A0AA40D841_9PEZI|nr:hypothetical protein QBC41DRAFT_280178 [Cercophora samala]